MTQAQFVTEPIVVPLAQMQLMPEGAVGMMDWVRSRAPACVPEEFDEASSGDAGSQLDTLRNI